MLSIFAIQVANGKKNVFVSNGEFYVKNTKHRNFIFSNGIDFIYEFFKYENKAKNNFLLNSLKYIGSKNSINNMLKKIADTGLNY